jgi:hypothetical protein
LWTVSQGKWENRPASRLQQSRTQHSHGPPWVNHIIYQQDRGMPNKIMIDLKGALKVLKLLLAVSASFLWLRFSDLLYAVDKGDL